MSHNNSTSYKPEQTFNLYLVKTTLYEYDEDFDQYESIEHTQDFEFVNTSDVAEFQANLLETQSDIFSINIIQLIPALRISDILELGYAISDFERSLEGYTRSTAHEAIDADYGP